MNGIEKMKLSIAFGGTVGMILGQLLIVISNWLADRKAKKTRGAKR